MSHITLSTSQTLFRKVFATIRDNFEEKIEPKPYVVHSGKSSVTITLKGKVKLENGEIDLVDPNRIRIHELDVVLTQLDMTFEIDIQEICIGRKCIFQKNPDIVVKVDLVPFFNRIEASLDLILDVKYIKGDPDPQHAKPDYWVVTGQPDLPDIDIDIADTLGDFISEKLIQEIKDEIPGDSNFERLFVQAIGNIGEFIREVLDTPDDLQEEIQRILLEEFGITNIIIGFIIDHLKNAIATIYRFENPYEMMKKTEIEWCDKRKLEVSSVKVPLINFDVEVKNTDLVIHADIGN